MARTNWQPGDAFTNADANALGAEINALREALAAKEPAEWTGTQAAYDALPTKDPNRSYNIT